MYKDDSWTWKSHFFRFYSYVRLFQDKCYPLIKGGSFSFLAWHLLPAHYGCRGLLLQPITLNDTNTQHTYGKTPHEEGSARRRDLYLTDNIHKRQTSMPPLEFEPASPESERPQSHALNWAATGMGKGLLI